MKIGFRTSTVVRKEPVSRPSIFRLGTVHGKTFAIGLWTSSRPTTRFLKKKGPMLKVLWVRNYILER
jgi:hypothetical protein